jgi:DNA replication protein DnaC
MEARPWEVGYVDLAERMLQWPDEVSEGLYAAYPSVSHDWRQSCPTCGSGAKRDRRFFWRGEWFDCDCRQQLALHKHYLRANIGESYQRLDWDDYHGDPKALEVVSTYLERHGRYVPAGLGLFLRGQIGTGKTMLAALIAKAFVRLGYSVFFVTFPEMIEEFTKGWGDNASKARFETMIVRSRVLVLDDIGKEYRAKSVNLAESTFDHVLRRRVANLRPTIVTTNLAPQDVSQGYGASILSLLNEQSIGKEIAGADWRTKARDRTKEEADQGWRRPIF